MSQIKSLEKALLQNLKKHIELKTGHEEGHNWSQKDFEFLIFSIERDTGVLISLSTLKRIWQDQHNRLPHTSTLDALCMFAYKGDWNSLKKQELDKNSLITKDKVKSGIRSSVTYLSLAGLILGGLAYWYFWRDNAINGDVKPISFNPDELEFTCEYSASGDIPNSVLFHYDVTGVVADSFFIQQSWDWNRRVQIRKEKKAQTDIYYTPGYYYAKLMANDSIIKTTNVHIRYPDWFPATRQHPTEIETYAKEEWQKDGYMGVSKETLVGHGLDLKEDFQLNYYHAKEFGVDGDNFQYATDFRMDSIGQKCPNLYLLIKGENGYFWIPFIQKGCESIIGISYGDKWKDGSGNNLFKFGTDIYSWQRAEVSVKERNLSIRLNGEVIFEDSYQKAIGQLKAINYYFTGVGQVDNVELRNDSGHIVFADDFESAQ